MVIFNNNFAINFVFVIEISSLKYNQFIGAELKTGHVTRKIYNGEQGKTGRKVSLNSEFHRFQSQTLTIIRH